MMLSPLYLITDRQASGRRSVPDLVKAAIEGGLKLLQYREKELPKRETLLVAQVLRELTRSAEATLIINDDVDLAMAVEADGVHLGQEDLPPAAARKILGPEMIIGYSTHSPSQAAKSEALPIDYLAFGPVYTTATKRDASPVVGLAALRRVCANTSKPVVAIGGIDLIRVREVLDAGAQSAAIISALMGASNLARRMEEFLEKARERR